MRLRSWVASTCSSSNCIVTASDSVLHLSSESSSDEVASVSTLQSNLSLQSLPSVPSLQKLVTSLDDEKLLAILSVSSLSIDSKQPITCLAIHGSLVYAASGYEVNVFDLTTNVRVDTFNNHDATTGSVKSVTFVDGKVLTSHQDCKIRAWKVMPNKQHRLMTVLPTVNDRLRRFILPKNYVSVRRHRKRLWIEHADAVTGLAVNEKLIYSVSWDKCLKIWNADDLCCLESVTAHNDAVNAVTVSRDGTVYTGSADHRIRVWAKPINEKRHALIATLEKHRSAINALALDDVGSVLFSGACDRSILVWEREDSANHMVLTGALRGHGKAILSLIYVSDLLMSGSADRTVRIWRRGFDGRFSCLSVLEGHNSPVKSLAAGHGQDGVVSLVCGSLGGEIKMWQVSSVKSCCPR